MSSAVLERETDKRAAGERIGMRRALAGEVRQEEDAFRAWRRNSRFFGEHIVRVDLAALRFGRERLAYGIAKPLQRAAGGKRNAHHVPFAAHRVAESVQT